MKVDPEHLGSVFPPGHFYSPIPSLDEVRAQESQLFPEFLPDSIPGIDLNIDEQLAMLEEFKSYYPELPLDWEHKTTLDRSPRYCYENDFYSYSDAICLYCMIRYLRPKRIVEIGSGYSSAIMLDTNETLFSNSIACAFIDPYPERLYTLLSGADQDHAEIIASKVQDVDLSKFAELESRDILFVDSSHVSKIGSDVNHILFTILPILRAGVHVHFHDVKYGFEYPKEWIYEGRAWNEAYLLRAFLMYNAEFRIVLFNTFLELFYREWFEQYMPLCLKNLGGSIWLRKAINSCINNGRASHVAGAKHRQEIRPLIAQHQSCE